MHQLNTRGPFTPPHNSQYISFGWAAVPVDNYALFSELLKFGMNVDRVANSDLPSDWQCDTKEISLQFKHVPGGNFLSRQGVSFSLLDLKALIFAPSLFVLFTFCSRLRRNGATFRLLSARLHHTLLVKHCSTTTRSIMGTFVKRQGWRN